MSEANFYGQRGQLVKSWQFDLQRSEEGLWTAKQTYYCHRDDLAALMPARGASHPTYPFMVCDTVSVSGMEGDWVEMGANYAGIDPNYNNEEEEAEQYTYATRITTVEEPVSTAPYFSEVPEWDRGEAVNLAKNPTKDKNGEEKRVDTSDWENIPPTPGPNKGTKLELYKMVKGGLTNRLEVRVEFQQRYSSETLPTDLNNVNKISNVDPEGAPTTAGNRNWLFTGYNITEKAPDVYDIERVWLLSGPGGWNTNLYETI